MNIEIDCNCGIISMESYTKNIDEHVARIEHVVEKRRSEYESS